MHYITDIASLTEFCDRLRGQPSLALDTEFSTRSTYYPRLRLVQLRAGEHSAVVDCYRVPSLGPVLELLYDPAVEKVVHAGRQDLAAFVRLTGKVPHPVFDTMIAGSLLGYGAQASYQLLVERLLGKRIAKGHAASDWDRPELSPAQLRYAHEDVLWLPEIAEKLKTQLGELGRTCWLQEEMARTAAPAYYLPAEPDQQYLRIKERSALSRRALVLLRELAAWREREAQEQDRPRNWVIPDGGLASLARRTASRRSPEAADLLPEYHQYLPGLREAALRAWERLAEPVAAAAPAPKEDGLLELLLAFVRARCLEAEVAPTVVATRDDVQALCQAGNGEPKLPLLEGWRRELIGQDLLALLSGELMLGVDRESGRILATPRPRAGG